ncbi:mammalian cell entry protein [Mycobacterium decipiens]|uniref:Mammalian cell entry protein n=1 Tax=Mycobacterium decipiens TaxID=1430326 RepID=A0A1X2LR68_9MYCO|nr:mammalian cell entry protein [Mycobacterium decipiens]OSC38946.1 mammalian cell entry protein [Mycobacterium decipiens]
MSVVADPELPVGDRTDVEGSPEPSGQEAVSAPRRITMFGLAVVVALATLVGWLGFRVHQSHQAQAQRSQYLQVARQAAVNLTTIDYQHADADVRRILDGATGEFYNDFARRSGPFIEVLKQAKADTVGTITEAGLQTQTADTAQVLVAVSVRTFNAGEADPVPRSWRMRITVQKVGDQVKVSNVGFVP